MLVYRVESCMITKNLYGDIVLEPSNVVSYGCDEEFVWVVVLGA